MRKIIFSLFLLLISTGTFAQDVSLLLNKASHGDVDAMLDLGEYYYDAGNKDSALTWYMEAIKHKSTYSDKVFMQNAEYIVALIQEEKGNMYQAVKWYKIIAEEGNGLGQAYMARFCIEGKGTQKSYTEAIRWSKLAISQGSYIDAEYILGLCYYYGKGVERNYALAFKYFTNAANYDEMYQAFAYEDYVAGARKMLSRCYRYGRGTSQDESKAIYWTKQAAGKNDVESKKLLDIISNGKE